MSSMLKTTRRGLVKWGLGAAGLPLISQALGAMPQGSAKPEHSSRHNGQTLASTFRSLRVF